MTRQALVLLLLPVLSFAQSDQPQIIRPPQVQVMPGQAPVQIPEPQRLAQLAGEYWDAQLRLSPLLATFVGDHRFDDRLDDPGPAGRAEEKREYERLLKELLRLDPNLLGPDDRVSASVMRYELERRLEGERYKFWEWNVDQMEGPQTWIPTVVSAAQPMKTGEDAEALLLRMQAMPGYFATFEANLREGLRDGRAAARVPVEKTISQLDAMLVAASSDTVFGEAARKLPANAQAVYAPRILAAVDTHVRPALRGYQRFLKEEYLPESRVENIGLSALPDGAQAYRYLIRYHTTLDLSAEEVHALGLEQLKGIRAEMEALAKRLKWKGDLASFLDHVRKDPANYYGSREEVLKDAQERIAVAQGRLPRWFGILPKTPLLVKPFEAYREQNEVDAQYFEPSDDFSRPGTYYVNAYMPRTRARFQAASLAAHEGVPGHHLQIAIAMERPGLPAFRRHGDYNAFVEGWALYTERLADEMGLYKTELDRLGMLSMQAWRACRLVVDTGIHAMGWSRRQAIDFMKANTAMGDDEIAAEVDRYTIWPGQALAYKIGQREISSLREAAQKAQGRKFDIKKFHDAVLENGPLPLELLRDIVTAKTAGKP